MSNTGASSNFSTSTQQKMSLFSHGALYKSLAILGLVLFLFYTILRNPSYQLQSILSKFQEKWPASTPAAPTNISHIVFGIVGSVNTWKYKRSYIESWWQPNVTRGYIFMDSAPGKEYLPWPSTSPPFRVNEDITKLKGYPRYSNKIQLRIVHTVLEVFREGDENVRWYVMADDDTVLVIDNLVDMLAKYDHTKYLYIGTNSECTQNNFEFSFDMAYGGAGYALSYPLMKAISKKLDGCIERYPPLYTSDSVLGACLADLGIDRITEKGFHQIDLHGDISGLLAAHPHTPFLSLHHLDTIEPIFPNKSQSESINHLLKAAKVDPSRILQQTICYDRLMNWTFSVAWGYSVHIYESIFPRSVLRKPLETFRPWRRNAKPPFFMFNSRWIFNDCEAPHAFFRDSIEKNEDQIVTTYVRKSPRGFPACSASGNHSAESITKIMVFSPINMRNMEVERRDCCDVMHNVNASVAEVKYRTCEKDELIA
ncbi:hypothetical protein L6164_029985 [Bauhinia variegata]|uniref:Uncharacterized protein n=1 Tax=Bauhinia variegata TaxID=167791 RepID=A0ACB9LBC4_BAUVA|nr:hypothetical protein L6164_029985 [Bauhinia variegata]